MAIFVYINITINLPKMLKNLRRIGAAFIVAALVLPHVALATSPHEVVYCLENGAEDCIEHGNLPNMFDGDTGTSQFIGAFDKTVFRIQLSDPLAAYSINEVTLTHAPNSDQYCDDLDVSTSPDNSSYTLQDTYSPGEGNGTQVITSNFTAVDGTKYIQLLCDSVNSGVYWNVAEIEFDVAAVPSSAPEMEFWALLVILPMMGYVAYRYSPSFNGAAA
jgi:hypothetical protein